MNSYFVDHPEMVLGDTVLESTPYGKDDITVRPIPGAELSDLLNEAVSRIQGTYQAVELPEADKGEEVNIKQPRDEGRSPIFGKQAVHPRRDGRPRV